MRIFIALPHYFAREPSDGTPSRHGSTRPGKRDHRRAVVRRTIDCLRQNFAMAQGMIQIEHRKVVSANQSLKHELQISCVVRGDDHLISDDLVDEPAVSIAHQDCPAMELGFAAQRSLAQRIGEFDWYGYLEDDLWIHDPWFFRKLAWFQELTSGEHLLQPNRYEVQSRGRLQKCYVDGDLAARVTKPFQSVQDRPELQGRVLGQPVRFVRPANPHSGCFFLSDDQMRHWVSQLGFGQPNASFVGPLESAATLGVMKHFRLYKPAAENAAFLELQHGDAQFIHQIK